MDIEHKRLYNWLPWALALALLSLFIVLLRNELTRQENLWKEGLVHHQNDLQLELLASQQDITREAMLQVQLIAQDPAVIKMIRQAYVESQREGGNGVTEKSALIREQLNTHLQPSWKLMQDAGARELIVFFAPSATVFIRTHKPDRFGDSVSSFRPMLMEVFKTGTAYSGMEVGHFGSAYRAAIPIYDNDQKSGNPIAVLEVGLALLPPRDAQEHHGQAVLLHPDLVGELLWGNARADVQANSANMRGQWGIESYTDPIIKAWQLKGLLPDPLGAQNSPTIFRDGDKAYFICINRLADFAGQRTLTPLAMPKVVVLTWDDVTEALAEHETNTQIIQIKYLIECLLAELALLLLFRYNRRHVVQLLKDHSRLVKQERDLSEHARQRLNLALVSSESGFWEWNIAENRAIFSKEWRELCGLPVNDDGTTDIEEWLNRVHPTDKRASYNEMIRHIKGETPMFENEYRLRTVDGSYKWISTRGKVVERLPNGRATLMVGVYTDVTNRKKNEIIVIRQQSALHALIEIASLPVVDAEEQLHSALIVGSRYLGLPLGIVSHIQGHQYQVKVQFVADGMSPRPELDALSNYLCEQTYNSKEVFALDDIVQSEYSQHPARIEGKLESYIGAPIWLKGKIYGTLCFASEHTRYQEYDDLDKDFIRLFARWVGVTLERWLHQSEQQSLLDRFDKLCNQLPGFLYQFQMRPDGTSFCPYASAGIQELYGVSPQDVMESGEKLFAVLHPDDLGWIGETVSYSAAHLTPWISTFRIINPARGERWIHAESRPEKLSDGSVLWHGFIVDVTDEKKAELKLQEVNSLREAIFDAASIAIVSTDVNGLIKTFNRGAEKMSGYSASEMININTPTILHVAEEISVRAEKLTQEFGCVISAGFEVFIARAREGNEDEQEWTYVHKDGSRFAIMLSITALRSADGEITGYLALGRDISELKRIDRMKGEFISTVSHELRTPLTAISGSLGIIMSGAAGDLPDTAAKMLNIAHKNSLRLIHLVNDLLDMEKLVAGKMHFELQAQSLLPILQQSIEANSAYAAQYQVRYVLNNLTADDIRVNTDPQRLLQVMANFLSNAAKFSPLNEQVDITLEKVFGHARVTVTDKGPGIPDDFRNRIFQKFSQADSSDSRQKGGTGLGLAICKEIIERMGGKIGFSSTPGQGAQFYFEIPCEDNEVKQLEKSDSRSPTGNRLLIIEDDPEVAQLLATILRNKNFRADIAYTGEMALERMALYDYQVITIDLKLPDIDGLKLIRQLRTDSSTHQMPIIVISASLDDVRLKTRNDPDFNGIQWLQKPLSTETLVTAIKKAIQR